MALSPIFEFADRFVTEQSELDPCLATSRGIPGYDHLLTDFSPHGHDERCANSTISPTAMRTIASLAASSPSVSTSRC